MKGRHPIASINRWPIWRRAVRVWGSAVRPTTFDRWLYLWLNRMGVMGRSERAFLESWLRPGMRVADVGANVGLYTLLMARLVGPQGRVFAFEPEPGMAAALARSAEENGSLQVLVREAAVGDTPGTGILRQNPVNSGDGRMSRRPSGAPQSGTTVPICTLDEALAGQRVDFVKMDIQGWESNALRGARELVRRSPAVGIYFEFWPSGLAAAGSTAAELKQILEGMDLKVVQPRAGRAGGAVDLEALASGMKPGAYVNLLAVPVAGAAAALRE